MARPGMTMQGMAHHLNSRVSARGGWPNNSLTEAGSSWSIALELLGMNASGHEQAVDAEAVRAGEIRAHGIADRQHPVEL